MARQHQAAIVVSNASAKITFLKLLDKKQLPAEFVRDIETYRTLSSAFKINIACERLPQYKTFDAQEVWHPLPDLRAHRLRPSSTLEARL